MGASTCSRPRPSGINKSSTSEDTTKHYFAVSAPAVAPVPPLSYPAELSYTLDVSQESNSVDETESDLRSTLRVMERWRDGRLSRFQAFTDMRANFGEGALRSHRFVVRRVVRIVLQCSWIRVLIACSPRA